MSKIIFLTRRIIIKNHHKEQFAQGTIEYLVIIAIVVVIALVVVSLLLGQMNSAGTTNEQNSKLYWSSQPLAITDSIIDDNGTMLLVIKNNTGDWIELTSIKINNNYVYPDNTPIAYGETKSIYLNKNSIAAKNSEITLTYQTKAGLEKTQKGTTNLLTTQTTTITPSSNASLLSPQNCFDWNGSATQHTICSCNDLNTIDFNSTTRAWTYILQNNIDFRNCDAIYTTGAGWDPIGNNSGVPFIGNFLGNNKTISGLYVNRPDQNYVGLFGYATIADINDLGVLDQNVTGSYYSGGLTGTATSSIINNSYSTGNTLSLGNYAGGLTGNNTGTISNSYSAGNTYSQGSYSGGLTGNNSGTISDSYSAGNITAVGSYAGGITGANSGTINSSYSTGNIIGYGAQAGGITGSHTGTINNSYSTGSTTGTNSYTGGIVGLNSGRINNSFTTGSTIGTAYVGGITGYNYTATAVINNSYSTGSTTGTGSYTGGLVGRTNVASKIINSYSAGFTTGGNTVGGLVGRNDENALIYNSFSTGTVIGTSSIGGVVGYKVASSAQINLYWFDSNASDNATICYYGGDGNCTKVVDTNYSLLFDPATNLYDSNEPFWTFGTDANWTARDNNYPLLTWQVQ